jgi:hypothetical protein
MKKKPFIFMHGLMFWKVLIFILIVSPGCVGVGGLVLNNLADKGTKVPSETIEQFKNMPEDSPALHSLREQAKKDPESMIAASLKCAGRLEEESSMKLSGLAGKEDSSEKIDVPGGKEECYWRSSSFSMFNPSTSQQSSLPGSLRISLINLGKSQAIMAKAMGLDEQVMLAENNVKGLEAGDLGTSDEVEKSIEASVSIQEAIAEESAKKKILDDASKAVFVSAVPFYIKGVLGSIKTGKEAFEVGKNMASLSPMALMKIGALVQIVSNLPTLITQLASSSGQIMDFMTANEIDKSEMKDKLSDVF